MPAARTASLAVPYVYVAALWAPAILVLGLVFGIGWIALVAVAAWAVLFVVIGFGLQLALNEFCRGGLFGAADGLAVTGTASLLSALAVAGFLGA